MRKLRFTFELEVYDQDPAETIGNVCEHLGSIAKFVYDLPRSALVMAMPVGAITGRPHEDGVAGWRCVLRIEEIPPE